MCYSNEQIPSLGIFSKAILTGMQIFIYKIFIKVLFKMHKNGYIFKLFHSSNKVI